MNESLTIHQRHLRRVLLRADAQKLEAAFALTAVAANLPRLARNYKFDLPDSEMELDYAHLPTKVGVEIQGGLWKSHRTGHSSAKGIERDIRKNNAAQMKGWLLLHLTPQMAQDGSGALLVEKAIQKRLGASLS